MLQNPPGPVVPTYRTVDDDGTTRRLARALLPRVLRRPAWLAVVVAPLLFAVLTTHPRTAHDRTVAAFAWLVVLAFFALSARRAVRRTLRRNLPSGTETWSGFGERASAVRSPLAATETASANVSSIERVGEAVVYRLRRPAMYCALPGELVPDHELEKVRRAVAPPTPRWNGGQ